MKTYCLYLVILMLGLPHVLCAQGKTDTLSSADIAKEVKAIKALIADWKTDKALKKADELIRLAPNSVDAYNTRMAVYLRLGDYDKVCTDIYKAKELGDVDADAMRSKYCKWYNDYHNQEFPTLKVNDVTLDSILVYLDGTVAWLHTDTQPEFTGGSKAMMKFTQSNVVYPAIAKENDIQGISYVQFVVFADGSLGKFRISKSAHPYLDIEALRVVRSMPNWRPGTRGGTPVNTVYKVPISFKLR